MSKKAFSLHFFKQKINVELINAIEWVPRLLDRTVATTSIQFFIYFVSHFNDAPGIFFSFFRSIPLSLTWSLTNRMELVDFSCTQIRRDSIKAGWNKRMDGNKWRKIYTINYEYTHRTNGFSKILPLRVDTQTKQNEYLKEWTKIRQGQNVWKKATERKKTGTHRSIFVVCVKNNAFEWKICKCENKVIRIDFTAQRK